MDSQEVMSIRKRYNGVIYWTRQKLVFLVLFF